MVDQEKGRAGKESSLATWATLIKTQIVPHIGDMKLAELEADHLNTFYGGLLVNGRRDGKGGLAASSVAKIHTCTHLFLAHAVRNSKTSGIRHNVAGDEDVEVPGAARPVVNTWTIEETQTYLGSVQDDRNYAAYALVLNSGLRRGELLALAWRDVDLTTGDVHVRRELLSINFKIVFSDPKSFAGRRSIAIDENVVEILKEHRLRQLKERTALGLPAQQPDDLVFSGLEGEPLHPGLFSDAWDRRVKRAGVKRIRLHDARHTHASQLLAQGESPKVVQERLGHATIAITLALYSHTSPMLQRNAAAKLGSLIFKKPLVTKP